MQRASSSRARRMPTTSASSTCVSSYAGEWRPRLRPLSCSTCCSRAAQTCGATTRRARARCSTSWRRFRAGCLPPTISAGRSHEPMRPAPRPDAWSRSAASFRASREPKSFRCLRRSGRWSRIGTWRWRTTLRAAIATRPPLAGPRVLLTGAPVDGHELHEAIESHGAVVVAEVGPWGSGAAGDDVRVDDDPVAALADKYRADAIGARTPAASLRALDGGHARRRRCRRRVAAAGRCGVRLGLSGAARRAAGARHPACLSSRRPARAPTAADHARSTRWCPLPRRCRRRGMADKQLEATTAASAFQKQWFADLRRRVFDERQPYALLQADVPFELFDLLTFQRSATSGGRRSSPPNARPRVSRRDGRRRSARWPVPLLQPRFRVDALSRRGRATLGRSADASPAVRPAHLRLHSSRLRVVGRRIRGRAVRDRSSGRRRSAGALVGARPAPMAGAR